MKRRAMVFAICSAGAAGAAVALKPRHPASDTLPKVDLERHIPSAFEGWSVDNSMIPILPNPELQARLDAIYTQLLVRTYVNRLGEHVMLSVAYGSNQGSDATSVHRPEFCYSSQGFTTRTVGQQRLNLNGLAVSVRQLVARMGARVEPITYWVTMNDEAVLPGLARKLKQIELGLKGQIPDGMLIRVSTIGVDEEAGFALQKNFVQTLSRNMAPDIRSRYFGKISA